MEILRSLETMVRLLRERDQLLTAVPPCACQGLGACVPHALQWIWLARQARPARQAEEAGCPPHSR